MSSNEIESNLELSKSPEIEKPIGRSEFVSLPPHSLIEDFKCSENMDVNSDIYASETLQVTKSDVDDEDNDEEHYLIKKKISPLTKESSKIVERHTDTDSDEDENYEKQTKRETIKPSRRSNLIDSDSSDCSSANSKAILQSHASLIATETNLEPLDSVNDVKESKTKLSSIIDSKSEEENSKNEVQHTKIKASKRSVLIDTDSDSSDCSSTNSKSQTQHTLELKSKSLKKRKHEKKAIKPSSLDSNSEEEIFIKDDENKKDKTSKISSLIDTDSDSSSTSSELATSMQLQPLQNESLNKQKPEKRASAKKALKEIQAIRSETQRLTRENNINVPYHIPKHHTLKEFMKRRTISKQDGTINNTRIKMNQEELENYAKHLEERAKEASDFFRSDSENENNSDLENVEEQSETVEKLDIATNSNDNDPPLATSCIIESVVQTEEQPSLNLESLRKLVENPQLTESPTIKGDPKMLIDFETGNFILPKPSAFDQLKERFLKNSIKKKPKQMKSLQILSTENGQINISKIDVPADEEETKVTNYKPGAAFFKLKENLRTIIAKKRKEEIAKKFEEDKEKEEEIMKCGFNDEDDEAEEALRMEEKLWKQKNIQINDEEEIEEDLEEDDFEETEQDEEHDNLDIDNVNKDEMESEEDLDNHDDANKEYDNEDDDQDKENDNDEDENDDDDDDDDESDDGDDEKENENKKPKNRIIRTFEDSDEDDDNRHNLKDIDSNILNMLHKDKFPALFTQKDENIDETDEKFKNAKKNDFISQIPMTQLNNHDDEDELIGLCSGKFVDTQKLNPISQIPITQMANQTDEDELIGLCSGQFKSAKNNSPISQIPMTQFTKQNDEDELMALCSGTFPSTGIAIPSTAPLDHILNVKGRNKLLSSDEEDPEVAVAKTDQIKVKKLKKRKQKKTLDLSDDEDEISVSASEQKQSKDQKTKCVEYDSEENEIVGKLETEDWRKEANLFVENEAELSESEWGSADENEEDVDQYEIELGDEDEFDKTKIRQELEQIHMRKMLDDDIREVKKIQDLLFEDEENDGIGRQRQFRWKNNENGFNLEDNDNGENDPSENLNESKDDEVDEQTWRKMRHERELVLEESLKKLNNENQTTIKDTINSSEISVTLLPSVKKINIITSKVSSSLVVEKKKSTFLITKSSNKNATRGSFLDRDADILSKLANMTKSTAETEGTAGTVKKPLKSKNFVFTTITKQEHTAAQNIKRKTEDTAVNPSVKKQKICQKNCFIDQLL